MFVRALPTLPTARPLPATGAKWLVSVDGGSDPRWLAGGKQLSFTRPRAGRAQADVFVVDVLDGPAFQWSPARPLLTTDVGAAFFDITRDGKRVLAGVPTETTPVAPPFTIVLDWKAALKP